MPRGLRKALRQTIAKNLDVQFHNAYDRLKRPSDVTIGDILRKVFHAPPNMLPGWSCSPVDEAIYDMDYAATPAIDDAASPDADDAANWPIKRLRGEIAKIRADMLLAANELRFEEAASMRDRLQQLEALELARA